MRVTMDDPMAKRVRQLYCDGVELHRCFEFDTEQNYALCYDTNEDGRVYMREDGNLPVVKHEGVITFELRV